MPKHVFYNFSYAIIMSNTIKETIKMSFVINNQLNGSWH